MLKCYKYRIYPTPEQETKINKTLNVCRFVFNLALETKSSAWRSAGVNLTAYDLQKQLTDLKKEYAWLSEVDSQALQYSIMRLDVAYKRFYNGDGFPKFKSKKGRQTFHCPRNVRRIDFENQLLTIPKIKNIPIVISRVFKGEIRCISIIKTSTNKYFASVLVKTKEQLPPKPRVTACTTIGIDVGIKSFVICSDGRSFEPNRYLKGSLGRLKCLQRRASKKRKGSKNRIKATFRLASIHEKISNQRTDYINKITTELIRDKQSDTFVIEDLHVSGMLKNRKLSQAISDVSFGEFFRQLNYKCEWYGKNLIIINRFAPSSKRCSNCGDINRELTLADREWTCKCGVNHDRDLNAAKNIKWFGLQKIIL